MSQHSEQELQRRQQWSALMDGEADAASTAQCCAAWRDEVGARATWHEWHLIGDVLRSDDLASPCSRDVRFVASLRERLGAEPVVLAPPPQRLASRRTWISAAAVAAGLVMVVSAVLVMNLPQSADAPVQLAAGVAAVVATTAPTTAPAAASPLPEAPPAMAEPQVLVADGQLIRDARLDRYLAAHKPLGGNPALAMPTTFVRSRTGNAANGR